MLTPKIARAMLIYEYKLVETVAPEAAIEEAIRTVQFIRNKALRLWMDTRGTGNNDLQCLCAELAREFPFARRLNSQARPPAAGPGSHLPLLRALQAAHARQEELPEIPAR